MYLRIGRGQMTVLDSHIAHHRLQRTENGYGFAYGIRAGGALIGMVFVDTTTKNEKSLEFPNWTLDFFLIEEMENQGIMY